MWYRTRVLSAAKLAFVALPAFLLVQNVAHAQSVQSLTRRLATVEQKLKALKALEKEFNELKGELKQARKEAREAKNQAANAKRAAAGQAAADIQWHLGGYATAEFTRTFRTADGRRGSFGGVQFSPIFLISYKDLVFFESEVEIAGESDEHWNFNLEFATLSVNVTDWLTVSAGKFLTPVGSFNQHQHPAWINKLPFRPAGFVEDGGTEPLEEVGLMLKGALHVDSMVVEYAIFVGNGPRISEEGVKLEGFATDIDNNKAFGGRIAIHPTPNITVGFSGMASRIMGDGGTGGLVSRATYSLIAVDAAFTKGNWDIRGEYIRAHLPSIWTALDPEDVTTMIPGTTWQAWYAQAAYRLAGITRNPILAKMEPVVRLSQYRVSGGPDQFKALEESRLTVGVNYWLAPSAVVKVAFAYRDFKHQRTDKVFKVQLAFGF
jgi:Phosphate-selective porin O and P